MQVEKTCIFYYKFSIYESVRKIQNFLRIFYQKGIDINGQKDYYAFNK